MFPESMNLSFEEPVPNDSTHIKRPRFGEVVWYEKRILADVAHPNVIKLQGASQDGTELYIEAAHHDLYDHIAEAPNYQLDAKEVLSTAHNISGAMSHLHRVGYCHNDIKAENIVMCHTPYEANEWLPKLIDFEFAHRTQDLPPEGRAKIAGTDAYFSPEKYADAIGKAPQAFQTQDGESIPPNDPADYCRQAADCWALGTTLHLSAFGCFPNGTGDPLPILAEDFKSSPGTDPDLATLLENLLTVDPAMRWDADQTHTFLAAIHEPAEEASEDSDYSWGSFNQEPGPGKKPQFTLGPSMSFT